MEKELSIRKVNFSPDIQNFRFWVKPCISYKQILQRNK